MKRLAAAFTVAEELVALRELEATYRRRRILGHDRDRAYEEELANAIAEQERSLETALAVAANEHAGTAGR